MATTTSTTSGDATVNGEHEPKPEPEPEPEHEPELKSEPNVEEKEEAAKHPQGLAIAMIIASVMSSLLLVGLVNLGIVPYMPPWDLFFLRIEPSSPRPLQSSPTISMLWAISPGTLERISSAAARHSCSGVESTSSTAPRL